MVNFFSIRHSNKSSCKTGEKMPQLGAAARRTLLPILAGIHQKDSRHFLSKCLSDQEKVHGLHLGCGRGEDTFLLASLLNKNYTLHGVEEDIALVEVSKRRKDAEKWKQVQFFCACPFNWKPEQQYDFIYSRIWTPDLLEQINFLSSIRQNLKKGARLIVEIMQFSGYSAYPYNHAFARSTALISQLEQANAARINLLDNLYAFFERAGFQTLEITQSSPAFLPKRYNGVISLLLELFKEKIRQLRLTTSEELNALHHELKRYEAQQDILVSRPGVWQVMTSKN